MPDLSPVIMPLCDTYVRKLDELHDDHVHTRGLWQNLLVRVHRYHENPSIQNPTTGSVTAGVELAGKARASIRPLKNRSFKDIVAQFELFTVELLRVWLSSNTTLIKEKALDVQTLLSGLTLAEVQVLAVCDAIESSIAEKMYGRPEKWLNYLRINLGLQLAGIDSSSFVEMKARRDVLEHNNGIVEATYHEKAKTSAKYKIGDAVQLLDRDVDEAYQLVRRLIEKTTVDAIAKSKTA